MSTPSLSKFLPDDFEPQPIGLIAGKGRYPMLTAECIRAAGAPLRLVSFAGETEPSLIDSVPPDEHIQIKVGQLGKLLKSLKKLGCSYALMAGQITPKRLFRGLHPDLKALAILNSLKSKTLKQSLGPSPGKLKRLASTCWMRAHFSMIILRTKA